MLKNMTERHWQTDTYYELTYDDGHGCGFAFPCDEHGNVNDDLNPAAVRNIEYCKAHPEKFVRFGKVVKHTNTYREPASGDCECGERVILVDEYCGACECPSCGRWYNLFGEELNPPEEWEEPIDYDY